MTESSARPRRSARAEAALARWARDASFRAIMEDQVEDDSLGSEDLERVVPETGEQSQVPGVAWLRKVNAKPWTRYEAQDGTIRKATTYKNTSKNGTRVFHNTLKVGQALLEIRVRNLDAEALRHQATMDALPQPDNGKAWSRLDHDGALACLCGTHHDDPTEHPCAVHPSGVWTFDGRSFLFDRSTGEVLRAL